MTGSARAGMTNSLVAMQSGVQPGRFGAFGEIEIVRAKVGQLAFQTFDVQPQRGAIAEHQKRAAARGIAER